MKPCAQLPLPLLFGLALVASTSHAQSRRQLDEDYFAVGLTLGPAGNVAIATDSVHVAVMPMDAGATTVKPVDIAALSTESPLGLSVGGTARYVFALHPYFALGAQFGVAAWRSQQVADLDRPYSWFFDLGVAPQARLPLGPSFELYVAVPLALTLSALSEAETWIEEVVAQGAASPPVIGGVADVDPRFGYRLGAALGARWALADGFGVLFELGYLRHAVVHPVDVRFSVLSDGTKPAAPGTQLDLAIVTHQFGICAGVFF